MYIDTSAWIALTEPRDAHHAAAQAVLRDLPGRLVTGHHTMVEFLDGVEQRRGQARAAHVHGRIAASPRVVIVPSGPAWDDALAVFHGRPSWDVDLSDCLSFALMRRLGMRRAFTFDRDFEKAGFEVVPG